MGNQQLHLRFNEEQVITILENYLSGEINSSEARAKLELGKTRFFELLQNYRNNSKTFTLRQEREKPTRGINPDLEKHILKELKLEKKLIENKNIPISSYNYSAIRDNIFDKYGLKVSVPTIIKRAKNCDCYIAKKLRKIHDREVLTNFTGELLQHDSSFHLWSPYMAHKSYLITTLDDYSRQLLFADFFSKETAWTHILALKSVVLSYGCPLKYYPDQHSVFRFVKNRDKNSPWANYTKFTDDIDTQFKQVLNDCKIGITYALSPQAKGKVERPYRWLQDRVVRIAVKERITTLNDLRIVLKELVNKYNNQWIHSTTKEIPVIKYEQALKDQKSLFKPFKIPRPYQDIDDIFALRVKRIVDSYRNVSLDGLILKVPKGRPKETVDLRIAPDVKNSLAKIRFWQKDSFLGDQNVKLDALKIVRF